GRLWRLGQLLDEEEYVVVEVINATAEPDGSFRHYFLRVPPETTTARAAVAWAVGMGEREVTLAPGSWDMAVIAEEATAAFERLEQLADEIAAAGEARDHGIAWAQGSHDLHDLLFRQSFAEEDTLIRLGWEGTMNYCERRVYALELPSGRELLVDEFDVAPFSEVIGVIDREDNESHLRAVQAAIS